MLHFPAQKQRISLQPWYLLGPPHQSYQRILLYKHVNHAHFSLYIRFFFSTFFLPFILNHFQQCTASIMYWQGPYWWNALNWARISNRMCCRPDIHSILDVPKLVWARHTCTILIGPFQRNISCFFPHNFHLWLLDIYWFMKNLIKHHSVHYWMRCGFGSICQGWWYWWWYAYHAWVGGNIDTKSQPFRAIFCINFIC